MRKQALAFRTVLIDDAVTGIEVTSRPFKLTLNASKAIYAQSVIIATGAESRWLGVPGENSHRGFGVSSCATCDGFLYRDQHVMVVGGGDTAMEVCSNLIPVHPLFLTYKW